MDLFIKKTDKNTQVPLITCLAEQDNVLMEYQANPIAGIISTEYVQEKTKNNPYEKRTLVNLAVKVDDDMLAYSLSTNMVEPIDLEISMNGISKQVDHLNQVCLQPQPNHVIAIGQSRNKDLPKDGHYVKNVCLYSLFVYTCAKKDNGAYFRTMEFATVTTNQTGLSLSDMMQIYGKHPIFDQTIKAYTDRILKHNERYKIHKKTIIDCFSQ